MITKKIDIYIDGGCQKNPGPISSWGLIMLKDSKLLLAHSGFYSPRGQNETSSRAEIMALNISLKLITDMKLKDNYITFFCDSIYVINCATKVNATHQNKDIWKETILILDTIPNKKFEWVKGHKDAQNIIVDKLARHTYEVVKNLINT